MRGLCPLSSGCGPAMENLPAEKPVSQGPVSLLIADHVSLRLNSNFISHQLFSYGRGYSSFWKVQCLTTPSLRATAKTFPWNLVCRASIDADRPWFRVRRPAEAKSHACQWSLPNLLLRPGEAGCICEQVCPVVHFNSCHKRKVHVLENSPAYFSYFPPAWVKKEDTAQEANSRDLEMFWFLCYVWYLCLGTSIL